MLQKQVDDEGVSLLRRLMEWRVAMGRRGAHIGIVLQQEAHHVHLTEMARDVQRTIPSIGGRRDIGSALDENLRDGYVIFLSAQVDGCQTVLRSLIDVGVVFDEQRRHVGVTFLRGEM